MSFQQQKRSRIDVDAKKSSIKKSKDGVDDPTVLISRLSLDVTGIPSSTTPIVCVGRKASTKNTIIQLFAPNGLPAMTERVLSILNSDQKTIYLDALHSIPGFEDADHEYIENTMRKRASHWPKGARSIAQAERPCGQLKVKILQAGALVNNDRIDMDRLETHLKNQEWMTSYEFENLITPTTTQKPSEPIKTGIYRKLHTLLLHPAFFSACISKDHGPVSSFSGPIIDVKSGTVYQRDYDRTLDDSCCYVIQLEDVKQSKKPLKRKLELDEDEKKKEHIGILLPTVETSIPKTAEEICTWMSLYVSTSEHTIQKVIDIEIVKGLLTIFKKFTLSMLKSLLQKLIRRKPSTISVFEVALPAEHVLIITILTMIHHPGSFNPSIGKFQTGLESLCRRLPITAYEDSDPISSAQTLLAMLSVACVISKEGNVNLDLLIIERWMDTAMQLLHSNDAIRYNWHKGTTMPQSTFSLDSTLSSTLINMDVLLSRYLHSFSSDEGMVRYISAQKEHVFEHCEINNGTESFLFMLDQHTVPTACTLLSKCSSPFLSSSFSFVSSSSTFGGPVFYNYLKILFRNLGGCNPRRTQIVENLNMDEEVKYGEYGARKKGTEASNFVQDAEKVQEYIADMLWTTYSTELTPESNVKVLFDSKDVVSDVNHVYIRIQLPFSLLSGTVGDISGSKICMDRNAYRYIITLPLTPSGEPSVILKPVRGMDDCVPKADIVEQYRALMDEQLNGEGLDVKSTVLQYAFSNMDKTINVNKKDGQYRINDRLWTEYMNPIYKIQIFGVRHVPLSLIDEDWISTVLKEGEMAEHKMVRNANIILSDYFKEQKIAVLQRLSTIIQTQKSDVLKMPSIGRNGNGTDEQVTLFDPIVYRLLLLIAYLCPAIMVVKHGQQCVFHVRIPALLQDLNVSIVSKVLRTRHLVLDDEEGKEEKVDEWVDEREAWEHQRLAIDDIGTRRMEGAKGAFLVAPTGSGKTLIAARSAIPFIQHKHVAYLIYILPESAIDSVAKEFLDHFHTSVYLAIPAKSSKVRCSDSRVRELRGKAACSLDNMRKVCKQKVLLVPHDQARRAPLNDTLISLSTFSILIIDEVHKMMYQSQRTQMGLSLCALSRFFIAMTGTPVIDSKMERLSNWLQMLSSFPIRLNDPKNFFTAASTMLMYEVSLGIRMVKHLEPFELVGDGLKQYRALVPEHLGGIKESGKMTASDLIQAISICHNASIYPMANLIMEHRTDGVFAVCKNGAHVSLLLERLFEMGIYEDECMVLGAGQSVCMKRLGRVRIVITTPTYAEGYTLTAMGTMVTSVYFGNQATRRQLDGRLIRIGQERKEVHKYVVHGGILSNVLQNHESAASLDAAITAIMKP